MQERRREQRMPAYLGGVITTERRQTRLDCLVRNTSGGGAKLVLAHTTDIPDQFELHIPFKRSAYRVRTCWRRPEEIGVEIVPLKASEAPIPIALARKIKRLEAENTALKKRVADQGE